MRDQSNESTRCAIAFGDAAGRMGKEEDASWCPLVRKRELNEGSGVFM